MCRIGLVLEGGAMRGLYTAGVLDVMLENNIQIDGIVSVSAGALFGVNYFSKQKGRVIRYSKRFCKDLRYMSLLSLLFTGNVVNKRFAYYKVPKKLDVFDEEEFKKNNGCYYVTITNVETGKSEYKNIKSCLDNLEVLRASSAMPMASKIIKLDGKKYLDGGISDAIPIEKCRELGFDKIIVVLTQPSDYRKVPLKDKEIDRITKKFKKYPKLIDTMKNRYKNYNSSLDKIIELEIKNEIFVFRPSKKLDIRIIERNKDKLHDVYKMGVEDSSKQMKKLKKYLKK